VTTPKHKVGQKTPDYEPHQPELVHQENNPMVTPPQGSGDNSSGPAWMS
jgi:hypothetical protein